MKGIVEEIAAGNKFSTNKTDFDQLPVLFPVTFGNDISKSIVGYNFRACFLYSNIEDQNVFLKSKLEGLYTLLIHPFYTVENQFLPKIFK